MMVFIDEYDTAIGVLKGGSQTTQQLASTINRDSSKTDIFQAILSKYKQEEQIISFEIVNNLNAMIAIIFLPPSWD